MFQDDLLEQYGYGKWMNTLYPGTIDKGLYEKNQ